MLNLIFCALFLLTSVIGQDSCLLAFTDDFCWNCAYNHYSIDEYLTPGVLFGRGSCQQRSGTQNLDVYISNGLCSSACDGSFLHPYNSILDAVKGVHQTISQAETANITFYLISTTNYILRQDITSNFTLFRRLNFEITFTPLYCSTIDLLSPYIACINDDVHPIINVKTDEFSFFTGGKLTFKNIDFTGIDLHSQAGGANSGTACYNTKVPACCSTANLLTTYAPGSSCTLLGKTVTPLALTSSSRINTYGFFNLEPIYDNPSPPVATLTLINVKFDYFNSLQNDRGFLSFIRLPEKNAQVTLTNVIITNSFFTYGIIWKPGTESGFQTKNSPATGLTSPTLTISSLKIDSYNRYGLIASGFTNYNIFGIANNVGSSTISAMMINAIYHGSTPLSFLYITNSVSPLLSFTSVSLTTLTNVRLVYSSSSNFSIAGVTASSWTNSFLNVTDLTASTMTLNTSAVTVTSGDPVTYAVPFFCVAVNSQVFMNDVNLTNGIINFFYGGSNTNLTIQKAFHSNISYYDVYFSGSGMSWWYMSDFTWNTITYNTNSKNQLRKMFIDFKLCLMSMIWIRGTMQSITANLMWSFDTTNLLWQDYKLLSPQAVDLSVSANYIRRNMTWYNVELRDVNVTNGMIFSDYTSWTSGVYITNLYYSIIANTNRYVFRFRVFRNVTVVNATLEGKGIAELSTYIYSITEVRLKDIVMRNPNNYINCLIHNTWWAAHLTNFTMEIQGNSSSYLGFPAGNGTIASGLNIIGINPSINKNPVMLDFSNYNATLLENVRVSDVTCDTSMIWISYNSFPVMAVYSTKATSPVALFTLSNSMFSNVQCVTGTGGAIMGLYVTTVQLTNVSTANTQSNEGGSIFISGVNTFTYNGGTISNSHSGDNGGGLSVRDVYTSVAITGVTFDTTSAVNGGGGLNIEHTPEVTVSQCSFIKTIAVDGGALFLFDAPSLTLLKSVFRNVEATDKGAVASLPGNLSLSVDDITINGATASSGGAFYIANSPSIDLKNVMASGLNADEGALLFVNWAQKVNLKTFQVSSSNVVTGMVYVKDQNGAVITISDGIFDSNVGRIGSVILINGLAKVTLENLKIEKNTGPLIIQTTFDQSSITVRNSYIANNTNDFSSDHSYTFLMSFSGGSVTFIDTTFIDNKAISNLIVSSSSTISMSGLTFVNTAFTTYPMLLISLISVPVFELVDTKFDGNLLNPTQVINAISTPKITLRNIEITNTAGLSESPLVYISSSSLTISDLTLNNCTTNQEALLQLVNIDLAISNSQFFNNTVDFEKSEISVINTLSNQGSVQIDQCSFNSTQGRGLTVEYADSVTISKSNFFREKSGLLSRKAVQIDSVPTVTITETNFSNLYDFYGSAVSITSATNSQVTIQNCEFSSNIAVKGGAILVSGDEGVNVEVSECWFTGNQAMKTILKDGDFRTGIAAAGIFLCSQELTTTMINPCMFTAYGDRFVNNIAESYGSSFVLSNFNTENIESQVLWNNSDVLQSSQAFKIFPMNIRFNDGYTGLRPSISFSSRRRRRLQTSESDDVFITLGNGQKINFAIDLTDQLGDVLHFFSEGYGRITVTDTDSADINETLRKKSNIIITNSLATIANGTLNFTDFGVYGPLNNSILLTLTITLRPFIPELSVDTSPSIDTISEIDFMVYIRDCLLGEIVKEDGSCYVCPSATYSLAYWPQQGEDICEQCPGNADCPGGSSIFPLKGYWRSTNITTSIIECPFPEGCLGGQVGEVSCLKAHHGNLCYRCGDGYARLSDLGQCSKCENSFLYYFTAILPIVAIIIYIGWQVNTALAGISKVRRMYIMILLKLLQNHIQQLSMISFMPLGWTNEIKSFFGFIDSISMVSSAMFGSVDCILAKIYSGVSILYVKTFFLVITPIILAGFSLLCWILVFFRTPAGERSLTNLRRGILLTNIIILYLIFPMILRQCLKIVYCMNIDNNEPDVTVLAYDPDTECWTSTHVTWAIIFVLVGIGVWGILTSLYIFRTLRAKRYEVYKIIDQIANPFYKRSLVQRRKSKIMTEDGSIGEYLSFLYVGYRKRRYYWEGVVLARKVILVLIGVFTGFMDYKWKTTLVLIALIAFIKLTSSLRPYTLVAFNNLDYYSMFILYITAVVGLVLYSIEAAGGKILCMTVIVVLNAGFLIYALAILYTYFFTIDVEEKPENGKPKSALRRVRMVQRFLRHSTLVVKDKPIDETKLKKKRTDGSPELAKKESGKLSKAGSIMGKQPSSIEDEEKSKEKKLIVIRTPTEKDNQQE